VSLLAVIQAIQAQLRKVDGEASAYVADNRVYSGSNMKQLNQAAEVLVSGQPALCL
jgi:transposase